MWRINISSTRVVVSSQNRNLLQVQTKHARVAISFHPDVQVLKKNDNSVVRFLFFRKQSSHKVLNSGIFNPHSAVCRYLSCFLTASPNDKYMTLITSPYQGPPTMHEPCDSADLLPSLVPSLKISSAIVAIWKTS